MATQVTRWRLTSVEKSLVRCVSSGEWLDLTAKGGKSRTCRAAVIRDILRGRHAADPDPRGLRLRGARITGRLDLANLTTEVHLELTDCLLEEGVLAREARMASIGLRGCRLEHAAQPPLDADGLACSALYLSGATIIGHAPGREHGGAVRLRGARIEGHLDCTRASLHNDSGPALVAEGLRVGLGMFLRRGFIAIGADEDGAVFLRARIGRHLVCSGATLINRSGPALVADNLRVEQIVYLDDGFTAIGAAKGGAVLLRGARIGGHLDCTGTTLINDCGPALVADGLQVDRICT